MNSFPDNLCLYLLTFESEFTLSLIRSIPRFYRLSLSLQGQQVLNEMFPVRTIEHSYINAHDKTRTWSGKISSGGDSYGPLISRKIKEDKVNIYECSFVKGQLQGLLRKSQFPYNINYNISEYRHKRQYYHQGIIKSSVIGYIKLNYYDASSLNPYFDIWFKQIYHEGVPTARFRMEKSYKEHTTVNGISLLFSKYAESVIPISYEKIILNIIRNNLPTLITDVKIEISSSSQYVDGYWECKTQTINEKGQTIDHVNRWKRENGQFFNITDDFLNGVLIKHDELRPDCHEIITYRNNGKLLLHTRDGEIISESKLSRAKKKLLSIGNAILLPITYYALATGKLPRTD